MFGPVLSRIAAAIPAALIKWSAKVGEMGVSSQEFWKDFFIEALQVIDF